ncbi:MAG: hypothetical protein V1872_05385 [bacterium]
MSRKDKKLKIKENCLWLNNICIVPIISGRTSFAHEVRRVFLNYKFECIAITLPEPFREKTLVGVQNLPYITTVISQNDDRVSHYFPVDPCDGMVEAVRLGLQERCAIEFISPNVESSKTENLVLPDEYAIEKIGLPLYLQSIFHLLPLEKNDTEAIYNTDRLIELGIEYKKILLVCSISRLANILLAYQSANLSSNSKEQYPNYYKNIDIYNIHPDYLYYVLGEIPYLTYLYERVRGSLDIKEYEKTEGLKELLLSAKKEHQKDYPEEIYNINPQRMQIMLHYIRNLSLLKKRLTPDLYEIIVAAKGVAGNDYALKTIEVSRFYPYIDLLDKYPTIKMSDQQALLSNNQGFLIRRIIPGMPKEWKKIHLEKKPDKKLKKQWSTMWNPNSVCSWSPEDDVIENFCGYVRQRALKLVGLSVQRVEEFQCTLKDGIHIKETLRNYHRGGKIYVKEEPQVRGTVGAIVFIFDEDCDGSKYPFKHTWLAEHENESTLAFFATDYKLDMIGPGIAKAFYGGALFIYPPQSIPDVWGNPIFETASNNMERLVMAGCYYSEDRYIAIVAKKKPNNFMNNYAKMQNKRIAFIPISTFSYTTLQKLRYFHVLNGKKVRGWANRFIR